MIMKETTTLVQMALPRLFKNTGKYIKEWQNVRLTGWSICQRFGKTFANKSYYRLIRVPVISVTYVYLINDVLCDFVWFTKNIKCAFTEFIYSCLYSYFNYKVLLAKVFSLHHSNTKCVRPEGESTMPGLVQVMNLISVAWLKYQS